LKWAGREKGSNDGIGEHLATVVLKKERSQSRIGLPGGVLK
jgi:hypothetical protein